MSAPDDELLVVYMAPGDASVVLVALVEVGDAVFELKKKCAGSTVPTCVIILAYNHGNPLA